MYTLKSVPIYFIISLFLCKSFSQETEIIVDKTAISFVFTSKDVQGSIGDLQSDSNIDFMNFERSIIEGSVSLESLKTGNFLRDWHLMSKKYFYRQKFPRLYFKSSKIIETTNGFQIEGILTMKGISKSIILEASIEKNKIQMKGSLNTSDWNINISKTREENQVTFNINLSLRAIQ